MLFESSTHSDIYGTYLCNLLAINAFKRLWLSQSTVFRISDVTVRNGKESMRWDNWYYEQNIWHTRSHTHIHRETHKHTLKLLFEPNVSLMKLRIYNFFCMKFETGTHQSTSSIYCIVSLKWKINVECLNVHGGFCGFCIIALQVSCSQMNKNFVKPTQFTIWMKWSFNWIDLSVVSILLSSRQYNNSSITWQLSTIYFDSKSSIFIYSHIYSKKNYLLAN